MTRYEELLSLFLDGEPSEEELTELVGLLKDQPKLAEDFTQELLIWEAWSQEHAPERSADAFLSSFHTRLRAEDDAPDFQLAVTRQIKKRKNPFIWQPLLAIAAVLVILLSVSVFFNPADLNTGLISTAEAGHIQIQGECVCLHCTLKMANRCKKAVRYVDENGEAHLLRLKRNELLSDYNSCFCRGPTLAIIEGEIIIENGEQMLLASSITLDNEKVL